MRNKLGMPEEQMEVLEKKLVQQKLETLDERFTFNCERLDFEYLKKLHEFLFCEFYYENDLGTRVMDETEEKTINKYLDEVVNICLIDFKDIDSILEIILEIWNLQPFIVGNTRTLLAYLKVLNCCFLLDLNIDIDMNIESNPNVFNKEIFVNQERLTKIK